MRTGVAYRCLEGCSEGRLPLDQRVYTCPRCGGLLEVVHPLAPLQRLSPAAWRERIDQRLLSSLPWERSGVWAHREWVRPDLQDEDLVTLGEGNSPLLESPRLAASLGVPRLFVKQCGSSQTGSFKDLGMTVLVSSVVAMRRAGLPLRAVVCASTGDTSAALSAYAAAAGIPTVVFLPRGMVSRAQLMQPLAHGAHVLALDTDFDGCMQVVKALTEDSDEGLYLANSMNSLRVEGQKTVAFEIARQLGWQAPAWVVLPGGNLGNVSALVAGFELLQSLGMIETLPRVCVAQSAHANPLFLASLCGWRYEPVTAQETAASAIRIGAPVSFPKAVRALKACNGLVRQASEGQLTEAAMASDRVGLLADPHTGVALAAARQLADEGLIGKEETLVVVSTANALKFVDFKLGVNQPATETDPDLYAKPVECSPKLDSLRHTLDTLL